MKDIVIGVDLGGTNIKAGAVSTRGQVLYRCSVPTNGEAGPGAVADHIAEAAGICLEGLPDGAARAAGLGVGSPGTTDMDTGVVLFAPNLPGWRDVPLRDMLQQRLSLPCALENDANAAALGEQWMGSGGGADSLVMITLGTGIGGGIVLDGKVWHGFGGVAGEVGHMSIHPDGPRCGCGNRGCIEAYASATAMVRRLHEAIAAGAQTSLAAKGEGLTAKDIHEAALAGDETALANITDTGRYLGIAVSNLMHVLNPEVIVLSGGPTAAGEMLLGPMRREVGSRAIEASRRDVRIELARLGGDAGLIGAARCFMIR